jgi:hypothetical protein
MKDMLLMDIHPPMACYCLIPVTIAYTSGDGNDEGNPVNREPNRKDVATTFTRKLVLDSVPWRVYPEHYTAATTVVVTAGSLTGSRRFDAYTLFRFLGAIAKDHISSTPPHILFDGRKCRSWETFSELINYLLSTPIVATQEYLGFDDLYFGDLSDVAYRMRAILHIQPILDDHANDLTILSHRLLGLTDRLMEEYPDGRVYLCGVPDLVLTPAELLAAGDDSNDIARVKVYQHMSSMSNVYSRTWDHFKSHVQFVNPGFRPTLEDVVVATEMGKRSLHYRVLNHG